MTDAVTPTPTDRGALLALLASWNVNPTTGAEAVYYSQRGEKTLSIVLSSAFEGSNVEGYSSCATVFDFNADGSFHQVSVWEGV